MRQFKMMFVVLNVKSKEEDYNLIFGITRQPSGASHYGDHSAHSLEIYDGKAKEHNNPIEIRYYDTRYDEIPTNKEKWIQTWIDFIQENWIAVEEVIVLNYNEEILEIED